MHLYSPSLFRVCEKSMTKESKCKGLVFIPKSIAQNPKVQQIFRADAPAKGRKCNSIKLKDISKTFLEKSANRPATLAYTPLSYKTI